MRILLIICISLIFVSCKQRYNNELIGYWELDKEFYIKENKIAHEIKNKTILNFTDDGKCIMYNNFDYVKKEFLPSYVTKHAEVYFVEGEKLWITSVDEYNRLGLDFMAFDHFSVVQGCLKVWDPRGRREKFQYRKLSGQEFCQKVGILVTEE